MPPVLGFLAPIAGLLGMTSLQLIVGVLSTAASVGLSYYQQEKAKQAAKRSRASQDVQQNLRQGTFPRYVVLGLAKVSGLYWFYEASAGFMYTAAILSDDIIDGVDQYYVNERPVLVDTNGRVTTPPFSSKNYVTLELKYGYTDQASSTILSAAFPGVITPQHTVSGVAYLVGKFRQPDSDDQSHFQTVFNSQVPSLGALVRGVLAYDPRNPSHDPAKAETWATTTNPVNLLLYYLTSSNGFGLSRALFDADSFKRVADFCDQLLATKTKGLRRRYEMGGIYSYDDDPVDIVEEILRTFAGEIYVNSAGLFAVTCDELDAPSVTITADMISDVRADHGPGALYEYTTIKSRFTSEDHLYKESGEEADPWVDAAARTRIGRTIPYSFDLPYVFRHDQARRLMKREWFRLNPEWTVTLELDFNGIELFGERVFRLVYPPLGINATFRIEQLTPDDEQGLGRIVVKASSISDLAFEWDAVTEEGTAPAIPPSTSESSAPAAPTALAVSVGDTGSNVRAVLTWTASTSGHTQEAQYRLVGDPSWTNVVVAPATRGVTLAGLTNAASYEFQVRVKNARYGASNWTSIVFAATPVAGNTDVLQSLDAEPGLLKIIASAQQSADAQAAYVEFTQVANGASVSWAGSITVPALPGAIVSATMNSPEGARDVYARSVGINGDNGSASGPANVTVEQTANLGDGSPGSDSGEGGFGRNDGGGSLSPSQGGAGGPSTSPSQQSGPGGGSGGGGGGGSIY